MYTLATNASLEPSLQRYLNGAFVRSVRMEVKYNHPTYTYVKHGVRCSTSGIHSTLKRMYYPEYTYRKRRSKTLKKGSNKKEGVKVGKQIERYISKGKKPSHRFAKHIVKFLERQKQHSIVACEVPVRIDTLQCVTQADILSQDSKGRIWVWELKCGSPNTRAQGKLKSPLHDIGNSRLSHWELQRHFTTLGLIDSGVNVYRSAILQVYDQYNRQTKCTQVKVKVRNPAKWAKERLPGGGGP